VSFKRLKANLLTHVQQLVRNGDFTEYGLARFLGVSQPHMHNVLNGIRPVTPELFDVILERFGMDVLDLCPRAHLERHLRGSAQ
jgi:predicted XRE-type DNA-binding protein